MKHMIKPMLNYNIHNGPPLEKLLILKSIVPLQLDKTLA